MLVELAGAGATRHAYNPLSDRRDTGTMNDARMHPALACLLALALCLADPAMALEVGDIPSPRPQGWVTDQVGVLDGDDIAQINAIGDAVHAQRGAELAVVVIATTGGKDLRRFATDLFNRWGLGHRDRDDGVLILLAVDDRGAELILGDGVDDPGRQQAADRIMQQQMVPAFRSGQPQRGLIDGARAASIEILGMTTATPPATVAVERPDAGEAAAPAPVSALRGAELPAAPTPIAVTPTPRAIGLAAVIEGASTEQLALTAGGGAGGLAGLWLLLRRWWRNRERRCARCNAPMQRLQETADDAHLSPAERTEERLASVDYDVWACTGCSDVLKLRYGAWFSRYARCPQCRAKAKSSTRTTLARATYDAGGRERVDEHCRHCEYRHSREYSTARLTRSSSSGHRSSGFGGGRSSGRGSSGRW